MLMLMMRSLLASGEAQDGEGRERGRRRDSHADDSPIAASTTGSRRPQILYFSAAATLAYIVPYSFLFLHPLSEKLVQRSEDFAGMAVTETVSEEGEETTHALVDKWATVNLGRMVLSGVAAVMGLWAALDRAGG